MKVQSAFSIRTILIILLTSVIFTGCAVKIPVGELPENIQIRHLGSASSATPLIWHPDGQWFVANKGGLVVSSLVGDSTQVSRDEPAAMAWSPTGAFLAASFVSRDKTAVRIYSADYGELAAIEVEGTARDLAWASDDELLIAAVVVKTYSFGGNYRVILHRWQQSREMTSETIADTSPLKTNIAVIGDDLYAPVNMQISPYRDEIVFCRMLTPPNAEMHKKLIVRHLASGAEKEIGILPIMTNGGRYLQNGERLFFSDGTYQSINRSIWGTEAYETYPPGQQLEISPGGRFKLIDKVLYRDREKILQFDAIDLASFSPDGTHLLFVSGRNLFVLSPLEENLAKPRNVGIKLLELRRWRSEGLITPQEYEKYARKLEK